MRSLLNVGMSSCGSEPRVGKKWDGSYMELDKSYAQDHVHTISGVSGKGTYPSSKSDGGNE